jgi:putative membrane protein (TIGR04086 family)
VTGPVRGAMSVVRRVPVLYGLTYALFWAVIGAVIITLWAHFGSMTNRGVMIGAYIVHCLAVLFGAIAGSRAASERGWYYGGMTGLIYALIMVGLSLLVYSSFSFDAQGLFRVLIMALIGAFGGILGAATRGD